MPSRGYQRPLARLTHPLVRRHGRLERVGWDEALDLVARRFTEIRQAHGPDAFCCFSCSKASNEMNFVAQKFMRTVIGTNNIDSCNRT
jgi:predicted molibdopterin-dependent oxidoreductase YjgC